jgi:rhodanese-related sulfurtransferase
MVKQITRDELQWMISGGKKFKLVDVLSGESYDNEHIRGALSIPLDEIGKKAQRLLDQNDTIVVYCASFTCQASTKAAEQLSSLGYKHVLDYKGGLADYKEGHLPLEGKLREGGHPAAVCTACHAAE